jgi:hypothetical protein
LLGAASQDLHLFAGKRVEVRLDGCAHGVHCNTQLERGKPIESAQIAAVASSSN